MADIKVRIEVNPDSESENITNVRNDGNAIANSSFVIDGSGNFQYKNTNFSGKEMLSWGEDGELGFTESGFLSSNGLTAGTLVDETDPEMFVWGIVPENREYSVRITLLGSENLKDVVFYGDAVSNQFPIEAIIDGDKVIYSDDYRWDISFEEEKESHTIEFTKWNRPNYNACITKINVMMQYLEIKNKRELKNIECISQETSQPREIFYGIIPNSGEAEVLDFNGDVADLISIGVIPSSGAKARLFVNNRENGNYIISDSDYNSESKVFSAKLDTKVASWNTLIYGGRKVADSINCYDLLTEILSLQFTSDEIVEMLAVVENQIKNLVIQYPFLKSDTFRETINKVCQIAQLNMVEKPDGKLLFVSARPTVVEGQEILSIPRKMQTSIPKKDLILKNKYDGIEMLQKNIQFKYNTIYSSPTYKGFGQDMTYNPYSENEGLGVEYKLDGTVIDGQSQYQIYDFDIVLDNESFIKTGENVSVYPNEKMGDYIKVTCNYAYSEQDSVGIIVSNKLVFEDRTTTTFLRYNEHLDGYWVQVVNKRGQIPVINLDGSKASATIYFEELTPNRIKGSLTAFMGNTRDGSAVPKIGSFSFEISAMQSFIEEENIRDNGNNIITLKTSEISQTGNTYKEQLLSSYIRQNIIEDYKNGISVCNLSVNCIDVYDINGNLAKNFSKGETISVGDFVRIDKDNLGNSLYKNQKNEDMYFKVVDCRFHYEGCPLIDLVLQEVNYIEKQRYSVNFPNSSNVSVTVAKEDGTILSSGDLVYDYDKVCVSASSPYTITSIKANGNEITNNSFIEIYENTLIEVTYKRQLEYEDSSYIEADGTYTKTFRSSQYEVIGDVIEVYLRTYMGSGIYEGDSKYFYNLTSDYQEDYISHSEAGSIDIRINRNECTITTPSSETGLSADGSKWGVYFTYWAYTTE